MKKANWLPVEGYENSYVVSYGGYVKSLKTGKRLKTFKNEKDYVCVWLQSYGGCVKKKKKVHRLVAIAHIPNPDNLPDVNHKLGRKWDNRGSQLEWSSRSDNVQHSYDIGLKKSNKGKTYKIKTHGRYQAQAARRRDKQGNQAPVESFAKTGTC